VALGIAVWDTATAPVPPPEDARSRGA